MIVRGAILRWPRSAHSLFKVTWGGSKKCARLLSRTLPLFRFHEIGEDIVNAGQVAFTLGLEPSENLRVKPDAHRYFPPDVAQPHQFRQLFFGQARNISEIDV